jgi:SAM-dependent methyltransferase
LISDAEFARRVEAARAPYRAAGLFAWFFARGKLHGDPVFRHLLERELIPEGSRVLDLGCGQGLLASLLQAPGSPRVAGYRGIELMAADVARAHRALGPHCGVVPGDIRSADFGAVDVVVILDVLHYMPHEDQDRVLSRIRAALPPGGLLLLRIGDAAAGLPFRLSNWTDWAVAFVRGHGSTRFHCRSVAQWRSALQALDFTLQAEPMSRGTPFANVLLAARTPPASNHA